MSKVAIIRCESYEYNEVKKAIKKGIDLLGGVHNFAKKGENILLKPNLLFAGAPEKCITTHPSVFKAVAEILKKIETHVSYGDSPGFSTLEKAANATGLAKAAHEIGIKTADFYNGVDVFFDEGIQNKKFKIAKAVIESDGLISISKLKTHGLTKFTGAIKNQFGCIPGALKGEFHVKLSDVNNFAKMLVDLNKFIKPRLFIMDGIFAMEGNGPSGGKPKKMNVLLFSTDPVALDAMACKIINLDPELVPTTKFGKTAGLGTYLENEIEILGDDINTFIKPDFDVNRDAIGKTEGLFKSFRIFSNLLVPKPYIMKDKCTKCGTCIKVCPVNPKALEWRDGVKTDPPSYNYNTCIRCYCCQELCPESAIQIKVPLLRRLIRRRRKRSAL